MTPQQLKNAILQQAIQGKLVEQRAEEYVSTELFNAKKNIDMNVPEFEIPNNWKLSTIEGVSKVISTKKYQIRESETLKDGLYPVISQSKEAVIGYSNDTNKLLVIKKPVIIFGDHTTVVKYIDFNFVVGADGIKIFEPIDDIEPKFLKYSIDFLSIGLEKKGGYSRHYKFIKNLSLPVPPLAEQKRIVEKIEELLPLVERYEKAWTRLEELNKKFPLDMQKAILGQAIQGKLVEQRAEEGTGQELFEAIQEEKQKLIEEGKLKKQKVLPEITEDEIPFEIPESWKWVRLGEILYKLTDGAHSTPKYTDYGIPFISVKDLSSGNLDFSSCRFITKEEHKVLYNRCNPEYGDILLTKVGTTGIPVIVDTDKEFSLFVSVALLKFNQKKISNIFLKYLINSPLVQIQAKENTRGVGNKNWVMRDISNTLIPLPPLAEQKRIVDKIEDLLPLVEKLK